MPEPAESHRQSNPLEGASEVAQVALQHAREVDTEARFPVEAIETARRAGLMSAGFDPLSDKPCDIRLQSDICFEVAQSCASSAMVLAMHYIQLDSLAAHGKGNTTLSDYLSQLAAEQRLIASVTSEVGVDGDLRHSIAAIEQNASGFTLTKHATTVSYGQHANDFLITARANADAANSDQRIVLALGSDARLETKGVWDTLGMRGTVSPGGVIQASGNAWQVLDVPFSEIAAISMVPLSHLLWASCWLGIAKGALDTTRAAVQKKGRKDPDSARIPANRLSDIHAQFQQMRAQQQAALDRYTELLGSAEESALTSVKESIRFNDLKIGISEGVVQLVQQAVQVVGISAYRNDSDMSLGRQLRDALSAPLMINNDRIRAANADMQLLYKDR